MDNGTVADRLAAMIKNGTHDDLASVLRHASEELKMVEKLKRIRSDQAAVVEEVRDQLARIVQRWGVYASAHEALGVLLEEFDEFKLEVSKKQKHRNLDKLRREGLDIAIVGIKIMLMVDAGKGRE